MNRLSLFLLLTLVMSFPLRALSTEEGGKVPACILTSLNDAQRYNLQHLQGKVLYVDFWASWCPSCAHAFPFMNALSRDLKDRGLQVIAVNLDEEIDDAQQFLSKFPADFTVVADLSKECAKDFKVQAMPSSFVIDRNGIVRYQQLGFRSGESQALRDAVERLLAEASNKP